VFDRTRGADDLGIDGDVCDTHREDLQQ